VAEALEPAHRVVCVGRRRGERVEPEDDLRWWVRYSGWSALVLSWKPNYTVSSVSSFKDIISPSSKQE
jgi:hypothetical protein